MAYRPRRRSKTSLKFGQQSLKNPPSASQSGSNGPSANTEKSERELNVLFQFNGHTFEAYETLGAVPGCSLAEARSAFEATVKSSDSTEHEFYELAYKAIEKSRKESL